MCIRDRRNAEGEALGWLNFNRALAKSDNVYFYEMGNRLGIENIDTYAHYFGLGEKTGINLVGEAAGNVASPEYKRKVFDQEDVYKRQNGSFGRMFIPCSIA